MTQGIPRLRCSECGDRLMVSARQDATGEYALYVMPCDECMERHYKDGYADCTYKHQEDK